jgi:uncharacterized protein YdhG (YjbR/CyaY superfamily)
MSEAEVTEYIDSQDEPKRSTLEAVRQIILQIEPNLEQVIMWKSAQFKLHGKVVVGLCAHKNHLSFSTPSAEVLEANASILSDFVTSKNSFQFATDQVLSQDLVGKIVKTRLAELI